MWSISHSAGGKTPRAGPAWLFVLVGRSDHREMPDLIASGEPGICGFVIDASNASRYRELIPEAGDQALHLSKLRVKIGPVRSET